MEYCRSLEFETAPDYKLCAEFFERCLKRHDLNTTSFDYTWKINRLSKEKEALKNSMLALTAKKPKRKYKSVNQEEAKKDNAEEQKEMDKEQKHPNQNDSEEANPEE